MFDARDLSLPALLRRAAARTDRGLIEVEGTQRTFVSWATLYERSVRLGAALQARGLKPGERVGLTLSMPLAFAEAYFGIVLAGGVPVPIYPPASLQQLSGFFDAAGHILQTAQARYLLADRALSLVSAPLQQRAPSVRAVFEPSSLQRETHALLEQQPGLDEVAMLQFTSGSTRAPRGVQLTHRCLAENIHVIRQVVVGLTDDDQAVSWLPLYHDMGLIGFLLTPLVQQITVALLPPSAFIARPRSWLELITERRGTISFGPHFAYAYCLKRIGEAERAGLDLSSWRVAGCGAEPIQRHTLERFAAAFGAVGFRHTSFAPCYGLAEFTLAATYAPLGRPLRVEAVHPEKLSREGYAAPLGPFEGDGLELVSSGRAVPGHQVQVVDEQGQPLPDRQVGEIRLRGPSRARGYEGVSSSGQTGDSPFRGEWLYTGDRGYLVQGELFVCGRIKEIIKVQGRTLHPQDFEWSVRDVPGLRTGQVVAFGVSDGDSEGVVLVAELRPETDCTPALQRQVARVASNAVGVLVREVVLVPAGTLPKTSSGKLKRTETRRRWEEGSLTPDKRGVLRAGLQVVGAHWQRLWQSSGSSLSHRSAEAGREGASEVSLRNP